MQVICSLELLQNEKIHESYTKYQELGYSDWSSSFLTHLQICILEIHLSKLLMAFENNVQ